MWERDGLPPFGLGLGLSTGEAAAALLGTEERLEYTLVGDTVNLSQRLQQLAESGETVVSQATMDALAVPVEATLLPEQLVKGRDTPVRAWRIARQVPVVRSGLPAAASREGQAGQGSGSLDAVTLNADSGSADSGVPVAHRPEAMPPAELATIPTAHLEERTYEHH